MALLNSIMQMLNGSSPLAQELQCELEKARKETQYWYGECEKLRGEIEKSHRQIQSWKEQDEGSQQKITRLQDKIQELRKENGLLLRQNEALAAQIEKLKAADGDLLRQEDVAEAPEVSEMSGAPGASEAPDVPEVSGAPGASDENASETDAASEQARKERLLSLSLEDVDMSKLETKTFNTLRRRYTTVGEICELSALELLDRTRDFGPHALNDLVYWLEKRGLSLRDEETPRLQQKADRILKPCRARLMTLDKLDLSPQAYSWARGYQMRNIQDIQKLVYYPCYTDELDAETLAELKHKVWRFGS